MDSEHPLLVSSIELWSLFSCKQFCPVCSSKEGDTSRCDDCLSLCTNGICRLCHVVQPLVPERWRLAEDNQERVIESPLGICAGPPSIFFVFNENNIFSVRLHYPVQVTKVISDLKKWSSVCYWKGIIIFSEMESGQLEIYDFKDVLIPKLPSRKDELQRFLTARNILFQPNAKVAALKEHGREYIAMQRKTSKRKRELLVLGSVTCTSLLIEDDLLFVSITDTQTAVIKQFSLNIELDKAVINMMRSVKLPCSTIPVSLTICGKRLYYVNIGEGEGLNFIELETMNVVQMVNEKKDHKLHGIVINSEGEMYVSCTSERKIFAVVIQENNKYLLKPFCGNGTPGRAYGLAESASFVQPTSMAADGKSVIIIDTATNSLSLLSHLKPLGLFLENCREIYKAFDIHTKSKAVHSFTDSIGVLTKASNHLESIASSIVNRFGISRKELNGSYGNISHETLDSVKILKTRMQKFCEMYPEAKVETLSKALTTEVNEHVNAEARALAQNAAMDTLTFALSYSSIVEEATKRICELPYNYFTSERHHYGKPENFIKFKELPAIPRLPTLPISKEDLQLLLDFKRRCVEPARVGTVRSDTMKDKFSTLPIALYEKSQPDIEEIDLNSYFSSSYKIKDKTPNNEIYSLHSLLSFQSDTTFHFAVSKAPVRKKDHEILYDIFTADSSSTEPNLMFLETKPVSLPMIKKYHGLFNRIFDMSMKMKMYFQFQKKCLKKSFAVMRKT